MMVAVSLHKTHISVVKSRVKIAAVSWHSLRRFIKPAPGDGGAPSVQGSDPGEADQRACGAREAFELSARLPASRRGHRAEKEGSEDNRGARHHQEDREWLLLSVVSFTKP